jgi:hypothetical protein
MKAYIILRSSIGNRKSGGDTSFIVSLVHCIIVIYTLVLNSKPECVQEVIASVCLLTLSRLEMQGPPIGQPNLGLAWRDLSTYALR